MSTLGYRCKAAIQRLARHFGYRVERVTGVARPVDVFDLAVRCAATTNPDFFFVQVGANDGVTDDPLRRYINEFHWRGLLLEPQPEAFRRLVLNYQAESQLLFEQAALASEDGSATMYTAAGGADYLASFRREVVLKMVPASSVRELVIPTVSVGSLLAKHGIKRVDLLQIDAEGFDFEVVRMFLAAGCEPQVIHYEHHHLSYRDRERCAKLLDSKGYGLHASDINTVAVRQGCVR